MGYQLRPGLSFCAIGTRILFLDVPADRYFCLSDNAGAAFGSLIASRTLAPEEASQVAAMTRSGLLLVSSDPALPQPPRHVPPIREIPIDPAIAGVGAVAIMTGLQIAAATAVRFAGLAKTLSALRRRRDLARSRGDSAVIGHVAAARRATLLLSSQDRCLSRSIALAWQLFPLSTATRIVIGVKLRPFEAHCWVELGDRLVNEQPDHVRAFTPILVL